MRNKNLILCITLIVLLALSGCGNNDVPQDTNNPSNQDQTANNQENQDDQDDQNDQNDQDDISNTDDTEDVSNGSYEDAYLLSTNSDFYGIIASNPIDQKYQFGDDATTLDIWEAAMQNCDAWNQQIDFTGAKLQGLLGGADYEQLQNAINLWHEYYQEEVDQNRDLYGLNGLIMGTMYTDISSGILVEKCKLTSLALLAQEYELSGNATFAEGDATAGNGSEYSISPGYFCIEYTSDFVESIASYSINDKNSDELETLIQNTASYIEDKFGHDFTAHANKYVSFIRTLYTVESGISDDSNLCHALEENRLKLYATELLNLQYMIDLFQ